MGKIQPTTNSTNRNKDEYRNQTPVRTYLDAKEFRDLRTWKIKKDGSLVTEINGTEISKQDFDLMFPIPAPKYVSFSNPDKTLVI